jgi:hypothetical protein
MAGGLAECLSSLARDLFLLTPILAIKLDLDLVTGVVSPSETRDSTEEILFEGVSTELRTKGDVPPFAQAELDPRLT